MSQVGFCVCLSIFFLSVGCGSEPQREATTPELVEGPVRVKIIQRTTEPIPGTDDRVLIHIGDITGGQVSVRIDSADGSILKPPGSMTAQQADVIEIDGQGYSVRIVELQNFPVGNDYAVFEIKKVDDAVFSEPEKIQALISAVEGLNDAVFIRNGKEYTPAEAAKHMRDKWRWKEDEIATAEDFIRIAATKSSVTGKPYVIRYADGREVPSGKFLQKELDRLEGQ
jgi:uncharacterized protein DUF5329